MTVREFVREWAWWASRRVTVQQLERAYRRHLMTRGEFLAAFSGAVDHAGGGLTDA